MPELPEVETVRCGLNKFTSGLTIRGGEVLLQRTLAYPVLVSDFDGQIVNFSIVSWHRRGKYLFAKLFRSSDESEAWLGVHLRMTGQLLWLNRDSSLHKHTRLRLFFDDNQELRFVDTRTFGKVWFVPPHHDLYEVISGLQKLGPEPFSDDFTIEYLEKKLQKSGRCIKTLLLDQQFLAGLGNIYADECLFKSNIHPQMLASGLNHQQVVALHGAIREVLQVAIDSGGTTFSDFISVSGVNGNYGGMAWVYKRTGLPCRVCNTTIERFKLNGRSTHFCPQCQSYPNFLK